MGGSQSGVRYHVLVRQVFLEWLPSGFGARVSFFFGLRVALGGWSTTRWLRVPSLKWEGCFDLPGVPGG